MHRAKTTPPSNARARHGGNGGEAHEILPFDVGLSLAERPPRTNSNGRCEFTHVSCLDRAPAASTKPPRKPPRNLLGNKISPRFLAFYDVRFCGPRKFFAENLHGSWLFSGSHRKLAFYEKRNLQGESLFFGLYRMPRRDEVTDLTNGVPLDRPALRP